MNKIKFDYSFIALWSFFYFFDEDGLLPIFFLAAAIHEMGHYIALKMSGGHLHFLKLSAFGAEMRISMSESYLCELFVLIAGPAFNFIAAYIFSVLGFDVAAGASFILGAFNLLPAKPLDGGKILEAFLCLSPLEQYAETISDIISTIIAISVFITGSVVLLYTRCNLSIFLVGAFLLTGQLSSKRFGFSRKSA